MKAQESSTIYSNSRGLVREVWRACLKQKARLPCWNKQPDCEFESKIQTKNDHSWVQQGIILFNPLSSINSFKYFQQIQFNMTNAYEDFTQGQETLTAGDLFIEKTNPTFQGALSLLCCEMFMDRSDTMQSRSRSELWTERRGSLKEVSGGTHGTLPQLQPPFHHHSHDTYVHTLLPEP